jgi:hypothetical protein
LVNKPQLNANMASHALEQLLHLESSQSLSIIHLSNGITGPDDPSNASTRTSDASIADGSDTTPASLAADLVHYKVCGHRST